jgi:hypothetical protein
MSRWFRHYAGLCRDEKLVSVAIKSKQPIERVVWIWCAILESAAEIDDAGKFSIDTAEIAYFLRANEADIQSVLDNLQALGRTDQNHVVAWSKRQFASDRSRERVAAHRERKRAEAGGTDNQEPSRNDDVTFQKRYRNSPETETDTETEKTMKAVQVAAKPPPPAVLDPLPPELEAIVSGHPVASAFDRSDYLSAWRLDGIADETIIAGVSKACDQSGTRWRWWKQFDGWVRREHRGPASTGPPAVLRPAQIILDTIKQMEGNQSWEPF